MFPWSLFPNQNSQFNDWMKKLNESGMEKHIDQLLSKFKDNQTFSNFNKNDKKDCNEYVSVVETFDYLFVTILLDEKIKKDALSVSYTHNQIYILGLNDSSDPIVYTLPSLVKKSNAEVKRAENKIEIKLPKFHDNNRVELSIS
ncbi:MAG: hypothetical protein K0R71_332 [Bacillales bacterium]|jgi:hypothetical protein|nr:hypothetical protein [Bacillales bacterium]